MLVTVRRVEAAADEVRYEFGLDDKLAVQRRVPDEDGVRKLNPVGLPKAIAGAIEHFIAAHSVGPPAIVMET
ncbi:hypothetical protein [Micromonospora chokoriensis]|uniref:hypothetical protein n=1 Tax=Micromonospora chokoriensis TaxID=356851 RepID=UPI0004C35031